MTTDTLHLEQNGGIQADNTENELEISEAEFQRLTILSQLDTFGWDWRCIHNRREFLRALFICDMVKGVMLISGEPGAGKTAFLMYLIKRLQLYFGRPPVLDFEPKPLFGPYDYFDESVVAEEMEAVTKMIYGAKGKAKLEWTDGDVKNAIGERIGSLFHGKTLGLDEAYKYLGKYQRTKLGIYLGDIIKQYRHYDVLMCLICPKASEINQQLVEPFITHEVRCSANTVYPNWADCDIHNRRTGEDKILRLYLPNWWDLYYSWNPITARSDKKFKIQV